jgi:hypothetical protein
MTQEQQITHEAIVKLAISLKEELKETKRQLEDTLLQLASIASSPNLNQFSSVPSHTNIQPYFSSGSNTTFVVNENIEYVLRPTWEDCKRLGVKSSIHEDAGVYIMGFWNTSDVADSSWISGPNSPDIANLLWICTYPDLPKNTLTNDTSRI